MTYITGKYLVFIINPGLPVFDHEFPIQAGTIIYITKQERLRKF